MPTHYKLTILCFILVIFLSHSKLGIYSPQRCLQQCYLHLDLLWLDTTKITYTNKACLCRNVSLGHAFSCTFGALPTIHHNDNFTVTLIFQICHDVTSCSEPNLQLVSGELLQYQTDNVSDEAHLYLKTRGFWGYQS